MSSVADLRKDWNDRLVELSQLSGSWDAGYLAVTPQSTEFARTILSHLDSEDIRMGIYPTQIGGLTLEWDSASSRFSVHIDRTGHIESRRSQKSFSPHPVKESRLSKSPEEVLETLREWNNAV